MIWKRRKFRIVTDNFWLDLTPGITISGKPRTHDPVFIQLLDGAYKDWVIMYDDISLSASNSLQFVFSVQFIPDGVTQEKIISAENDLRKILSRYLPKVIEESLKETE